MTNLNVQNLDSEYNHNCNLRMIFSTPHSIITDHLYYCGIVVYMSSQFWLVSLLTCLLVSETYLATQFNLVVISREHFIWSDWK
jgi:hypothetical protein